jgi:hypothetical protein
MVIDISDNLFPNILEDLDTAWTKYENATRESSTVEKIQPFIEFIVQCLVVVFLLCVRAALAALIGFLNVVLWVIVVFSMAAPMILSGLYEATIDRQVLRAVEIDVSRSGDDTEPKEEGQKKHSKDPNKDKVKYHIHLLYAVLVGNLNLWEKSEEPPFYRKLMFWKKPKKLAPDEETPSNPKEAPSKQEDTPSRPQDTPSKTQDTSSKAQEIKGIAEGVPRREFKIPTDRVWTDVQNMIQDLQHKDSYSREKPRTATRLKTMLQCQASFGATVGAPVAFYLGSFLFSVFGNHEKLGASDVSLSLAFGEWWMTIPHVAIVSGCLLAGNNPNTLEAIVSGMHVDLPKHKSDSRVWASFYKSAYQPVWMWERGRNKRVWIEAVQYIERERVSRQALETKDQMPEVKKKVGWFKRYLTSAELETVPNVGHLGWTILIFTASILVVVPFVLAYVTSFYTPTIGLSCRTFTFVLYFVFQSLLTIMWAYDFNLEDNESHFFHYDGRQRPWIPFALTLVFFIGSSFTAIIGTFMQIVGVYRNCLCNLPMGFWGSRDYTFTVSTNSAEGIHYAGLYWLSTGIASICLLVVFCYFGWWYQRHWRHRFTKVVDDVLDVERVIKVKKPAKEEPTKETVNKGSSPPEKVPQSSISTTLLPAGGTMEDRDIIKPTNKELNNSA